MFIEAKNISKTYISNSKVLSEVSFSLSSGHVVGLLGLNGAGKSTLMKILALYTEPSSGTLKIDGNSVSRRNVDIRRKIGYLPENNPLYPDMFVREYLLFVSKFYNVGKNRVEELIQEVGLDQEISKKIRMLSKGYRQRVGFAAAMLHNPDLLILDEPTTGLDPSQLVSIRAIIKKLGEGRIVLLSSHILQEVEALCDRVIVLQKGQLLTDTPIAEIDIEQMFKTLSTANRF